MDPEKLFQIVKDTEGIWLPERGRSHVSYYDEKEIHVTSLVKRSAADCYREILGMRIDGPEPSNRPETDKTDSYWGFYGDWLAFGVSPDFPFMEIEVETPLPNGWKIKGTIDWLNVLDHDLILGEGKSHRYPKEGYHDELAFRQVALYMALFFQEYAAGKRIFKTSEDGYKFVRALRLRLQEKMKVSIPEISDGMLDFVAPEGLTYGGLLVRIVSSLPEHRFAKGWLLTNQQYEELLSYYKTKAEIITQCVNEEDIKPCEEFDKNHMTELIRPFDKINEPPLPIKELLFEFFESRRIYNATTAKQKKIKAELAYSYAMGDLKEGETVLNDKGFRAIVSGVLADGSPKIKFIGEAGDAKDPMVA